MSKPRLKVFAVIDTAVHADTIITNVRAELVGKNIFEEHSLKRYTGPTGNVELLLDIRFGVDADRDAIRDWVRNQVQDHPAVKTWVLSAKISWHRCTHDDPVRANCTTTNYAETIK